MQQLNPRLFVVALAVCLSACNTIPVRADYDAAADLSVCHSYGWLSADVAPLPATSPFDNPINNKRLRDAIAKRLAAKGLQPVAEGATPDCLVGQAIGLRNALSNNGRPRFSFGVGTGWGGGSSGAVYVDSSPYAYREGRISVDLYRAAGRDPLWHAEAEVDVSRLTGADAERRIDAVVNAIFARFPARSVAARPASGA